MASHRTCIHRGFTLIEILLVVGLFTVVGAFAAFIDSGSLFGNSFRGEERTIVSMLRSARMDAMNNIGQKPHGLAIFPSDHPHSYVLFTGGAYTDDPSSYMVVDAAYSISIASTPAFISFEQLSGDVAADTAINLTDPHRNVNSVITINYEGAIDW